jgi:ribosome-associated protein
VTAIVRTTRAGKSKSPAKPSDLLRLVEKSLDDDKAEDIVAIDLKGKSSIADYMVIATGRSSRQLAAMAEHLHEKLKAKGLAQVGVEGERQGDWVLIDGGDVIVHLFRPEIRGLYNLEKMWGMELPEAERVAAHG